jgi:hypothetical protein
VEFSTKNQPIERASVPAWLWEDVMGKKKGLNEEIYNYYKDSSFFLRSLTRNVNKDSFFKRECSEIEMLWKLIESYETELKKLLRSSPLKNVESVLKKAKKKSEGRKAPRLIKSDLVFCYHVPDDLGESELNCFSDVGAIIQQINSDMHAYWEFVRENEDDAKMVKDNFNDFVVVKARVGIIERVKTSEHWGNIQALLMAISSLLRLDFVNIYAFCDSDKYKEYIVKQSGKRNASKYHAIRKSVLYLVGPKADKEWEDGSTLMHYKMIEKLMPEINEELRRRLLKSLEESYLNKKGVYKNKEVYERRKLAIKRGDSDFEYDEILPAIKRVARQRGRYFDPAEDSRKKRKEKKLAAKHDLKDD